MLESAREKKQIEDYTAKYPDWSVRDDFKT